MAVHPVPLAHRAGTMTSVRREQILAFRLENHHLARRLPAGGLLQALSACGVQNSPPGSAALSLNARVDGLRPGDMDDALLISKKVVQVWAMRAAPHLVPATEMGVFTTGLLPDDDAALLYFIQGATDHLAKLTLTAEEAVRLTGDALPEALSGRRLTKDALADALASVVASRLIPEQRALSASPDGWRSNTHGETVVRFALSILSLQGLLCLVPGKGRSATEIVLTSEWLSSRPPALDQLEAAATVLRRYLHCYGPSMPADYALWAGISRPQADRTWALLGDLLEPVTLDGKARWLLAEDLPGLQDSRLPRGVRLLPPHDPYLQARDRHRLVAATDKQRLIFRAVGNPGVVLVDGEVAGIWRPDKRGKSLTIDAQTFRSLEPAQSAALEAEAESLGPFRGVDRVELRVED